MKDENYQQSVNQLANSDEHDLFHLLKSAECIKVTSNIPVKEELSSLELAVYNFLLHLSKDLPFHNEKFTLAILSNKLGLNYSDDELVNALRNLDRKYYTECAFDDKGQCAWIKIL